MFHKLFLFILLSGYAAYANATSANENLSLHFQEAKLRAVLQVFADFTGLNIIVSDAVQGTITLHLNNVPWQQALDIMLQSQGLGRRQIANVLLIAPINEIAGYEKQELQALQQLQEVGPLHSELIAIRYGKAADIAALLQQNKGSAPLISKRGSVSADMRTNTVWVQETTDKLTEIRNLISRLDVPVKQVLVTAQVVNIDSSYEQELGIRYSIGKPNPPANNGSLERLHVDLPGVEAPGANGTASIALALGWLAPGTLLDLELSALESEGLARVISTPRLVTADQQEATIEAGEEIPFQQSTSSGATNIAFKKAVLSLNVTPQITPDGYIALGLKVNQDRANFAHLVQNVPPIDTRQITTRVLVADGQTVVLGGIYQTDNSKKIERIPFLGSLPLVGGLFRHTQVTNKRTELLIFITPRIITR